MTTIEEEIAKFLFDFMEGMASVFETEAADRMFSGTEVAERLRKGMSEITVERIEAAYQRDPSDTT